MQNESVGKVLREPVAGQLLYAVPQAARVLGISARLLWTFIARGEVKTRKIGSRVVVHRRDLEKFAVHDHPSPCIHKDKTQ